MCVRDRPVAAVTLNEQRVVKFIESIRLRPPGAGGPPLTWTPPEGSVAVDEDGFACFDVGDARASVALRVTNVIAGDGAAGSSILSLVNYWRTTAGLPSVTATGLPKVTRELVVDGKSVTLVNVAPPGAPTDIPLPSGRPPLDRPFAAPAAPATQPAAAPLTYRLPEGWSAADPGPMALLKVVAGQGNEAAQVSVMALPPSPLLPNINRWRAQLGLPPVEEADLKKVEAVEVGGAKGDLVDITGGGDHPKRIVAAVVAHGDRHWFFKMMGPADVVEKQKKAFGEFLASVRFEKGDE